MVVQGQQARCHIPRATIPTGPVDASLPPPGTDECACRASLTSAACLPQRLAGSARWACVMLLIGASSSSFSRDKCRRNDRIPSDRTPYGPCHTQTREIGLQTSWSADVLCSFNGSMTWSEALKQTAYTAELERKTSHRAGCEEHLSARLQREHAMTRAEVQASRRCFFMLNRNCSVFFDNPTEPHPHARLPCIGHSHVRYCKAFGELQSRLLSGRLWQQRLRRS